MPRIRPPHAAGARRPARRHPAGARAVLAAVADDVVHLGLAEHLVDDHAQLVAAVREHALAHGLAGAHDGLQREPRMRLPRLRRHAHHRLERGGKQEGVRDAVALHQLQRELGVEAGARRDDGAAEVQRGQQRVPQPARPGPVGRTPERPVALRTSSGSRRSRSGCRSARGAGSRRPWPGRWCRWCRSAARGRRRGCRWVRTRRAPRPASRSTTRRRGCPRRATPITLSRPGQAVAQRRDRPRPSPRRRSPPSRRCR